MAREIFPQSQLPIRRSVDLLPQVFRTDTNSKFMSAVVDPLIQPGTLQKTVGYIGRRYGKTYKNSDIYLDTDTTLRSRYQLEPGVVVREKDIVKSFYDYIDFKNQLKFFGNTLERDDRITDQDHYSWNPPIDWDKFVNFREYYWVPDGPPPITIEGQRQSVISTYRVRQAPASDSSWLFFPDGFTNNPTLTLYRGQTYKFQVNSPGEGFVIRTNYDTGSLQYKPYLPYSPGQLAVFDNKLWRAKTYIPITEGSTINEESQDWEFVEAATNPTALDYNQGVTNQGATNATLTFVVPLDAPDVLFYQSSNSINRFGRFIIQDLESNTKIDIEKEIIGKTTYKSSNGIELSNGMKIRFSGSVTPEKYAADTWIVEGVGNSISLIKFQDLITPVVSTTAIEVLFDNEGFDTQPYDDAANYPANKDYITINRASQDRNPWSRYNRWFHRTVLEQAYKFNDSDFDSLETSRAKRPIIEFNEHLQLFNHGVVAKESVDFIDTFTQDVFSTIEGSLGYNVDGEELFNGARLLVTADTDPLANNKIYTVNFITHNNRRQISLVETTDTISQVGEGVLVRRGNANRGQMYHYNGTAWVQSQVKLNVNQNPLFDVFDSNNVSFGDQTTYPVSTFVGSKIISYKVGNSIIDSELGFSLSYLNIDNVGDIEFSFDWDTEVFAYQLSQTVVTKNLNVGYYRFSKFEELGNGWTKTRREYLQPILDTVTVTKQTRNIISEAVDWNTVTDAQIDKLLIYVNGIRYLGRYRRTRKTFTFDYIFAIGDIVTFKVFTSVEPKNGYYEIPLGLEKNPLNAEIKTFTLGQAVDHVSTAVELFDDFTGTYPGTSNLRDITGYQDLGRRFLKHSGITPTAIMLLCDKQVNVIKSIGYAKKSYSDFKNNFIKFAETLDYDLDPINFVDTIIAAMTRVKSQTNPFADSDMIGSGAYSQKDYIVEDTGITTFALSEIFTLDKLSRTAVYVYKDGEQLINGIDYIFNTAFGFVEIITPLLEGTEIQIREYVSSGFNFIPPTPTKLGLYKKYTPQKFLDKTYLEPVEVIQGHDGSITVSYGDYRDDVLLELEKRIYNNLKQEYDEQLFDIDQILGGYYYEKFYNKAELDSILSSEFLKWLSETNIDYITNSSLDTENPFTYTYTNMTDPTGQQNLPGFWRGVYRWFYDTDRPHMCPWEMLGFTEKPDWWESVYGAAPYTSGNLILWEDLKDGIIRQGPFAGTYDRYKRSTLMSHIPVDIDGNLVDPLNSGLAQDYVLSNNQGNFKFGDVAPVESAWRKSSDYTFSIISALCLMRPFEFIVESLDRSRVTHNNLNQTVHTNTNLFAKNSDIVIPVSGVTLTSGLLNYVADYLKSIGLTETVLQNKIDNLDVNLSTRLSGFVDQSQQKYILDSKNPKASTSSIFIPQENYDINFNISSPISSPTYSAVIIEKVETGFKVYGYDTFDPYFRYFEPVKSDPAPLISVGGVSENFLEWTVNKIFNNGIIVRYGDSYFRCIKTHNSGDAFESQNWQKIAKLPLVGAVEVLKRTIFNQSVVKKMPYGTVFTTIQGVADLIAGYEVYLKSQGYNFTGYDAELEVPRDWTTSIKEFLFWTKHKWALGSIITLSPGASKLELNFTVGVADNLLDSFYDYNILKDDGNVLPVEFINVNRDFQNLTVETTNATDGIYFFKCYFVLKEHVTVFSDRTVFNDVLYDKPTGYRQERIKSRGFRTVDWDGDYTSPGFLFDNVNIQVWQPFTDYKLGDIVSYKSYNWTSLVNQQGTELFDNTNWTKLDSSPTKGLVTNFDVKVSQFDDYYNADADGTSASQRELARHLIGYQTREYLQNLAEDQVTQFKLYQGFIREKGTANAVVKVFDKLSRTDADSIVLNEEWAFRVGRLGGTDQINEIEFEINKGNLLLNPQPVLIVSGPISENVSDRYLRVNETNFTRSLIPYSANINPVKKYTGTTRNAGYVRNTHVDVTVSTRDEILLLDITSIVENSHIWITFESAFWTVLRYNLSKELIIVDIEIGTASLTMTTNKPHNFSEGEIIGIRDLSGINGFFKITSAFYKTFTIDYAGTPPTAPDESSVQYNIYKLTEARFDSYQDVSTEAAALLTEGSRLWINNSDSEVDNWEVVEKQRLYSAKSIQEFGATDPRNVGLDVLYIENLKQVITGMPSSGVAIVYSETDTGLIVKQILQPEVGFETTLATSFGRSFAVSPDNKWLAVGCPLASGVPSRFKGSFEDTASYIAGDIVLFNGKLWEAVGDQLAGGPIEDDGSTDTLNALSIKFRNGDWKPAEIIFGNVTGSGGPTQQGMVVLYKYENNVWNLEHTIVSPRMSAFEKFGSKISIGVTGTDYHMAISAPGSLENTGRVYLYKYSGTSARTNTQVLTFNGTVAVNFVTNVISFSTNHNYLTGNAVLYINGTYGGEDKSAATSPPPPEDYTVLYIIRITDTQIQLASSAVDAAYNQPIDLRDFGIDDSSSHTLINTISVGWQHLEDPYYRGVYNPSLTTVYSQGSKVWFKGRIYEALEDNSDSTLSDPSQSHVWKLLENVSTQLSLPTNIAIEDYDSNGDNSTLSMGSVYPLIPATEILVGETYTVESFGTTDFSSIGLNLEAGDGLTFKAIGIGTGTGTVRWRSYQFAELIKQGDMFGSSLAMNRDGSILVIGAPESDGQYFKQYRGLWTPYQEYIEDDVVKYNGNYYKLRDTLYDSATDSTYIVRSLNQSPTFGDPWYLVNSEVEEPSGKVFIYKRNSIGNYELVQNISNGSILDINDTGTTVGIGKAEKFGSAVDIDLTGTTIVVSAPYADANVTDQGMVYVFKTAPVDTISYRLKQELISHENYANEYFGSSVSISAATERIIVGAKNASFNLYAIFDSNTTTFDNRNTKFNSLVGSTGQVYVFERKDQTYHLTEKLYDSNLQDWESFGYSTDATASVIVVGSPTYRSNVYRKQVNVTTTGGSGTGLLVNTILEDGVIVNVFVNESGTGYQIDDIITINGSTESNNATIRVESLDNTGEITVVFVLNGGSGYTTNAEVIETGQVRLFRKDPTKNSWNTLAVREDLTDLDIVKNIAIYDNENNIKLSDLDIVDGYKLKILGVAEQELKFKTLYDPAVYTNGTDQQEVDEGQAWFEKHVGELWWDLSTAKWINYEQGDDAYRIGNWNQLAYGSSIDVYEWVESKYLPSRWAALADTTEGLAEGISGQPLYSDNSVYSVKVLTNSATGETTLTKYYYWVKDKIVIPKNVPGRRLSAASVSSYIESPASSNIPFVSLISADTILTYNFESLMSVDTALINIEYRKDEKPLNVTHNEYQLLTEGVADSLPTGPLEDKWIDSLVGYDQAGNSLPDLSIPVKQRYGISYKPRQSLFKDRFSILKTVITNINTVLETRAFADTLNFENLNLIDAEPAVVLNEYDIRVDTLLDLQQVGTTRIKKAELAANIINGQVDSIEIIDPGFGYKTPPFIQIDGDGIGALAEITLDGQGKVNSVRLLSKGRKYTAAVVKIRAFSVLVATDESINNYWSIYAWDNIRKTFFRSQSQAYDTTKFWEYIDWWKDGYGITSRIIKEISDLYKEPTISVEVGDLIKVKEFASGGWAVLEKTTTGLGNTLDNYELVGRQNGTLRLKIDELTSNINLGYDNVTSFDANLYDLSPTAELRNILKATKENIFIEDLRVKWNELFFACIRYSFVEQPYIDWAFKTSFLNSTHNVGSLEQKQSYKNDNLESFRDYIEEIKPYRTTVREFTSKYLSNENVYSATTDFDLPPRYSVIEGKIEPVPYTSEELNSYPYKWWNDNKGYSVVNILLAAGGSGYVEAPSVTITSTDTGTGATAQAYISNGVVIGIKILTKGTGYSTTPTVSLVGGNGTSQDIARAVAVLGETPVRTFDMTVKFDRISKTGYYQTFGNTEEFTADGYSAVFELKYAPSRDKSKISVTLNGQVVLNNEYVITLYTSTTNTYSLLKGKLTLTITPTAGDIVVVVYEKNTELLDSVNRIEKFYAPTAGMKGKELPQLMTGVDFGGVQIQGTTFDVTGGWDALPWFTDSWDSVESNSDFYYVTDGSTAQIKLPYVPEVNEQISVYLKRQGTRTASDIVTLEGPPLRVIERPGIPENRTIRIDDPNYIQYDDGSSNWDSSIITNPYAQMPTFVGDGINDIVDISNYLSTIAGDTLIFRKLDSDGSVTITDINLLDTKLGGGTFSMINGAYATATGMTPEEIIIDGEKFISPDQVPAPEENIPGQLLESVSIKVYHATPAGAAPLQNKIFNGDGETLQYSIGLTILESNSVMVYVDKLKQEYNIDYTINFVTNNIIFDTAPVSGAVIEIVSIGLGGVELLDYQEFVGDNETNLFLTRALYSQTQSVVVTLDGVQVDTGFITSDELTDTVGRTLIQLGVTPTTEQLVKVICLGAALDVDSTGQSLIRVNQQTVNFDGSTKKFDLDKFVNLSRASAVGSMLVTLNGNQLNGPDSAYVVYDGTNNEITLGVNPVRFPGSITYLDVVVFINNIERVRVVDWTLNTTSNVLTVKADILETGDVIQVINTAFSDYIIDQNDLVISDNVVSTLQNNDDSTIKDKLEITWFSEYPNLGVISDQYSGGKVNYKLFKKPLNDSYVWVYLNGARLTKSQDYYVSTDRGVIYLSVTTTAADTIKIVEFGENLWKFPSAFEIYKDMLNVYQFKRFVQDDIKLVNNLNYYDQTIEVTDGSKFFDPTDYRNVPGVVYINSERIEYFQKSGNILSQIRRGSFGSSIAETHLAGSQVSDVGPLESLPYNETQQRQDFVSDGSTLLIGPLDFTPTVGTRSSWYTDTIPVGYGPCDQIEVFVAGTRLNKNPKTVFDETLGAASPAGDKEIEADFSVDGLSPYIRVTNAIPAGKRITIIRKTGKIWYERGIDAASAGKTLQQNDTSIANFILQKTTIMPE